MRKVRTLSVGERYHNSLTASKRLIAEIAAGFETLDAKTRNTAEYQEHYKNFKDVAKDFAELDGEMPEPNQQDNFLKKADQLRFRLGLLANVFKPQAATEKWSTSRKDVVKHRPPIPSFAEVAPTAEAPKAAEPPQAAKPPEFNVANYKKLMRDIETDLEKFNQAMSTLAKPMKKFPNAQRLINMQDDFNKEVFRHQLKFLEVSSYPENKIPPEIKSTYAEFKDLYRGHLKNLEQKPNEQTYHAAYEMKIKLNDLNSVVNKAAEINIQPPKTSPK